MKTRLKECKPTLNEWLNKAKDNLVTNKKLRNLT